ncbi:MFS transporter [Lacrimispora sp.]|uniref:MFS transporter n=1 Tax=Lacrimispora sp. TaxID=2719234 RepID=UPI002FD9A095
MQKNLNRIHDSHTQDVLFLLCWLVYFASYIGRLNYSSAMPVMIGGSVITASQAGFISMVYFFAYGAGQFLNGILADRLHPGKMIFAGLFASGLLNLAMGFLSNFGMMALFWCANGYTQAMIWPPIMRIFAKMMTEEKKMKYCIHITSTMAVGTLASYLLSAAMIAAAGWRYVFYAASVCMCAAALVFRGGFAKVEAYAQKYEENESEKLVEGNEKTVSAMPFSQVLVSSGLVFLLVPVVVHGVLKDGVTSWVPTYISETFLASPTISILVTTMLPVINLTGAYAAQFMYRRYFGRQEVKTATFFFLTATGALFLLWRFSAVNMFLTAGLLSVITASMMAVNTLFVNLLPLHFEREGRVSTVSGFLNAMAYLGCAISTYGIGVLVQHAGWDITIFGWLLITAAAMAVCFVLKNKPFTAGEKEENICEQIDLKK